MVWNDVEDLAKASLAKMPGEALVRLRSAKFFINVLMIDDIIPVHTARLCLQVGRTINVTDAEIVQILR
jgi:hypothetical protein